MALFVLIIGEAEQVITKLLQKGIVVVAACSKRIVRERIVYGKQKKEVEFVFKRFREYRGMSIRKEY